MLLRRLFSLVLVFAVITAACGGDEATDTDAVDSGEAAATTTSALPETTTTTTAPETTTTTTTEAPLQAIRAISTKWATNEQFEDALQQIVDQWGKKSLYLTGGRT